MADEVACQHTFACTRCGTRRGRKAVVYPPFVLPIDISGPGTLRAVSGGGGWLGPGTLPDTRCSYDIFWGDDYPHYPVNPPAPAGSSRKWTDRVWFSEKPCNE